MEQLETPQHTYNSPIMEGFFSLSFSSTQYINFRWMSCAQCCAQKRSYQGWHIHLLPIWSVPGESRRGRREASFSCCWECPTSSMGLLRDGCGAPRVCREESWAYPVNDSYREGKGWRGNQGREYALTKSISLDLLWQMPLCLLNIRSPPLTSLCTIIPSFSLR